jgi:hypothetical protein
MPTAGAHLLGRVLREQGHNVKLIPAQFVKPFVKSNKNDFLDAEAIAEAVDRQNLRFVPIKTDDQRLSGGAGSSPPGWDLCRASTRPAARPDSSASASEATAI